MKPPPTKRPKSLAATPSRPLTFQETRRPIPHSRYFAASLALLAVSSPRLALANPQGPTVVNGSATITSQGPQMNVQVSRAAFIDWRSFNINAGETTRFIQPGERSVVINRIQDANPSQIWGSLAANGTVILANQNGFYFGPNSVITVGSLIVTTTPVSPDMASGGAWTFTGAPPLASIVNYGRIEAKNGGSLFLVAEKIQNHGVMTAPDGTIGLYAGKKVLVSERADGRGLSAEVTLPQGSVDNQGKLVADAGQISLQASVVNQSGVVQANSIRERNGIIELVAENEITLGPQSSLSAVGDSSGQSSGGRIKIDSAGSYGDAPSSVIDVSGGALGGHGGAVELCAEQFRSLDARMESRAAQGFRAGRLSIDPENIRLSGSGSDTVGGERVEVGDSPGESLDINVNTAFKNKNFSSITLQARKNITLGTTWDLSASTDASPDARQLTLQAGGNIVFEGSSRIVDAKKWSVGLYAGFDFGQGAGAVTPGVGSIWLGGSDKGTGGGAIETSAGSIFLSAGKDVQVGTGYIRTVGGGNIEARASSGSINAGQKGNFYDFGTGGYQIPRAGLLGITTSKGGNILLDAGGDVVSRLPASVAGQFSGASGAYGTEHGDVTVKAGGTISGDYIVRNGAGLLLADATLENGLPRFGTGSGGNVGKAPSDLVTLNLVSGSWGVYAHRDINIREVRNPNGSLNSSALNVPSGVYTGNPGSPVPVKVKNLFDYSRSSSVTLWAGNGILLSGENRTTRLTPDIGPIYPASLELNAGAGGIQIKNDITLFPSTQGGLSITTRDHGSVDGTKSDRSGSLITLSDSGSPDYNTFQQGHATTPLHATQKDPVEVTIDGSLRDLGLNVPQSARIKIAGDAQNLGLRAYNLGNDWETSVEIGGTLKYRGNYSFVPLAVGDAFAPEFKLLSAIDATTRINYDSRNQKLSFVGKMSQDDLAALLNPKVFKLDQFGNREQDANGLDVIIPFVLTDNQKTSIRDLFAASQDASDTGNSLQVAGAGKFSVTAKRIDLEVGDGIVAQGPIPTAGHLDATGAQLDVHVTDGDLTMLVSRIQNAGIGGSLSLRVDHGNIDAGLGSIAGVNTDPNNGITTLSGGNLSVKASGDINLNGSRIGTYNGGNVTVVSDNGSVNAGSGRDPGGQIVSYEINPETHRAENIIARDVPGVKRVSGNGIIAFSLRQGGATVGNISVTAAKDIKSDVGGIKQVARNGLGRSTSGISLNAGGDILLGKSGVFGGNIELKAGGRIEAPFLFGFGNVSVTSPQTVSGTFVGVGSVSVQGTEGVSANIVGASVDVGGNNISGNIITANATVTGESTANVGANVAAAVKAETKSTEDASEKVTKQVAKQDDDGEEQKKKKGKSGPVLTKSTGRVTVILPGKK